MAGALALLMVVLTSAFALPMVEAAGTLALPMVVAAGTGLLLLVLFTQIHQIDGHRQESTVLLDGLAHLLGCQKFQIVAVHVQG